MAKAPDLPEIRGITPASSEEKRVAIPHWRAGVGKHGQSLAIEQFADSGFFSFAARNRGSPPVGLAVSCRVGLQYGLEQNVFAIRRPHWVDG